MLQRIFAPLPLACIFLLCASLSATDTLTMTDGTPTTAHLLVPLRPASPLGKERLCTAIPNRACNQSR